MTRTLYAIRPLPLPLGSLGYENAIWLERRMLELNSYRRADESFSGVILRIAAEGSQ